MSNQKGKIDEFFLSSRILIENSLSDPEVRSKVGEFGYNEAKLTEGRQLYLEGIDLHNLQKKEYGEQFEATEMLDEAFSKADNAYMKALKVARVAFQNNPRASALVIDGQRKKTVSGWLGQADAFYSNLLRDEDLLSKIGQFGYTRQRLGAEHSLVKEVGVKIEAQRKEMGEAQAATDRRNRKLDELDRWTADYAKIVKVALDDDRTRLEKLGIPVRSRQTSRTTEKIPEAQPA